ncbi:hypothetical protein NFI96_003379 [Prochilodus magdalenae]|nr:hypothetical protein NFI96_003379 [Prochilodus magdalenae]
MDVVCYSVTALKDDPSERQASSEAASFTICHVPTLTPEAGWSEPVWTSADVYVCPRMEFGALPFSEDCSVTLSELFLRRQFGPKDQDEVKIIEHQTQYLRLMPHLATALALTFTTRSVGPPVLEHSPYLHGQLEHPHTVPADGAVGVEVEGHQAFWTCDGTPFISVLTTVPPHTDSLGVSTKTKAGLVTEDDPLPF